MNLGSLIYALLFVRRQPDLSKLPTALLEHAFLYSAVAYEEAGIGVLDDELWDTLGLELLTRKAGCSIDFHMAVNWSVLAMKSTNLALDLNSPICNDARQCMRNFETAMGVVYGSRT